MRGGGGFGEREISYQQPSMKKRSLPAILRLGRVPRKFIPNQKVNKLTIVSYLGRTIASYPIVEVFCECSPEKRIPRRLYGILAGKIQSCGCLLKDKTHQITHGHSINKTQTKEYTTWRSMKKRCNVPTCKMWPLYGGRGITIHPRWMIFENFLADMGKRPSSKHSLDRINNDGNYEPGNCRWATAIEQGGNTRSCKYVSINGSEIVTLSEASRRIGSKPIAYCLKANLKRFGDKPFQLKGLTFQACPQKSLTKPLHSHILPT